MESHPTPSRTRLHEHLALFEQSAEVSTVLAAERPLVLVLEELQSGGTDRHPVANRPTNEGSTHMTPVGDPSVAWIGLR